MWAGCMGYGPRWRQSDCRGKLSVCVDDAEPKSLLLAWPSSLSMYASEMVFKPSWSAFWSRLSRQKKWKKADFDTCFAEFIAEVAHQRRVRDCIRKDSLTVQRT